MLDEPKAVREIHEIRERFYEERKDWSAQQRLEHWRQVGQDMAKQLGLRIVPPPEDTSKKQTG